MTRQISLALIYGSTREGRFCDTVANWAAKEISRRQEFVMDVIDPARFTLPARHERKHSEDVIALKKRIENADAFVIVTPEYNHGYPAPLKFLIDSASREWETKPIAFVSYGGLSGGIRAVEQLRLVFAELHAVTIRDGVSFANVWKQFDDNGVLIAPEAAQAAMATLLERLDWWAIALRSAREAIPYRKAA